MTSQLQVVNDLDDRFPFFEDGDVLIVLSQSQEYRLHSHTLRLNSALFQELLADCNSSNLRSKERRDDMKVRYKIHHFPDPSDGNEVGLLALSNVSLGLSATPAPVHQHYDNLFRACYHQRVSLDDKDISSALCDVIGLVDVAEYLGSMSVVSMIIDNALMKQGQLLYRSVSASPTVWASLALRIQSEIIYREAIIHSVGQWSILHNRQDIAPEFREICQRKWDEVHEKKKAIDLRIMGYYPPHIQKPRNSNTGPGSVTTRGRGNSTRSTSYSSDIMAWMAISLFRHWVGQNLGGDLSRHAPDGGFQFYNALYHGGESYLDRNAVENFVQFFPMSAKSRNLFEEQVQLLKDGVTPYVASLLQNKSLLDVQRYKVGYLTCVTVDKSDMAWTETYPHAKRERVASEEAEALSSHGKCKSDHVE